MNVFVTGASGYVGFNVATALRRAGHEVLGLIRDEAKGDRLRRNEIRPVLGTIQRFDSYKIHVEQCSVIVHAAADYKADTFLLDRTVVNELIVAGSRGAQPKTLIYTSGVWVHGDTRGRLIDETAPLAPPKLVERRPGTEQLVLQSTTVRGLVIRPGCVYGRQGGFTGMWFGGAHKGALSIVGDGANHIPMVHVDDLADAYVRAAESGLRNEVFNITDRSRYTLQQVVEAVQRVTGYGGAIERVPVAQAAKKLGDLAECFTLDQHVDARKAVRRLGWQPKHGGFVDDIELHFDAWKAARAK